MMTQNEPPKYLENFTEADSINSDTFDHTDVVWTGDDGELDPDTIIAEQGWDNRSPLLQVASALVSGHQHDLPSAVRDALARKIEQQILGHTVRGRPVQDDGVLLLEIAHRYHRARFEGGGRNPPIETICKEVVLAYRATLRGTGSDEELPKSLAKKFKKDRDLWLSRATTGDGYYAPQRMDAIKKLTAALKLLQEIGVSVDLEQVVPTVRPEDILARKGE